MDVLKHKKVYIPPKRKHDKTPSALMIGVNTKYIRCAIKNSDVNLSELSEKMGYCRDYLSNSITDGRMNKNYLMMLSYMADFSYKDATAKNSSSDIPF